MGTEALISHHLSCETLAREALSREALSREALTTKKNHPPEDGWFWFIKNDPLLIIHQLVTTFDKIGHFFSL